VKTYRLKKPGGDQYPLEFVHTMGFEAEEDKGMLLEDLIKILEGARSKMAARVQREAQRLSSFSKILVIYLIISCIFARITRANHRYNRQTLLEIFHHCKNIVLDHPFNFDKLPPELTRTPSLAEPAT
ncbi:hypothetical protein NFI96_030055, partial [Prochilodus magdalenae]